MPVPRQELLLPIIPTDLRFFQDSFFEESRGHFEMAVKEIIDRFGFSSKDYLSSYRSLRQKELRNENQAVSVTDEVDTRKITIDVKDFKDGELTVKVVDHDVVAEGRVERKEGGSNSTHDFYQRISLPKTVDLEAVTSTISSDGILTITAPKNKEMKSSNGKYTSVADSKKSSGVNVMASSTTNVSKTESQAESHEINEQESSTQTGSAMPSLKLDIEKENSSSDVTGDTKKAEPETPLPLILRGSFFHDSFFCHAHRDFEAAIESILRGHDIDSSSLEAMKQYRSLREDKLTDATQAFTLSEDDTYHKIVLDVQDFKDGDVQIKAVGRSLVVEGRMEKNSNGSVSSHSFRRRFALPSQAQHSDVTAALSSDGILTILVEKKPETLKIEEVEIPILTDDEHGHRRNTANSCKQQSTKERKVLATENAEKVLKISKETSDKADLAEVQAQNSNIEQEHSSKQLHQQRQSMCTKEEQQRIEVSDQSKGHRIQVQNAEQNVKSNQSNNENEAPTPPLQSEGAIATSKHVLLPIEGRGDFFQDSFFDEDHRRFQSAVSKVLERFGMKSTVDDDLKAYRTLRQSISVEESQAAQITDEETNYKVVMDMRDFVEGDVKVKADGQMLVVAGCTEMKEASSSSSRSFRRCLTFSTLVDMEAVTSALSSDGVLTITAPKKKHISRAQTEERHKEEESRESIFPKKVSEDLSRSTRNSDKTTSGWTEQSSYHESSFTKKVNQGTS